MLKVRLGVIVLQVAGNLLTALKLDELDECYNHAPCGAHVGKINSISSIIGNSLALIIHNVISSSQWFLFVVAPPMRHNLLPLQLFTNSSVPKNCKLSSFWWTSLYFVLEGTPLVAQTCPFLLKAAFL